MAEDEDPPLVEPVIIPDIFCEGIDIQRIDGDVRLIAWVTHESEHRIVARLVLPEAVGRALVRDMRKALASDRH
ncbi:hypothetical protein LB545_07640 [Mesorhizobium sp. BR1-1-6]|uniref:hypothetical protein n=1 Tax=Mesorhizobium sp. BR1-1-6 TaxID=2876648 RepID=UPI001CD13605|nr:hypothetical protein [Mesorhizobium sp. BR1-1-6]MBZ9894215.1 hypothetical protein [Mesorhizobium sp. BR1-1-6]